MDGPLRDPPGDPPATALLRGGRGGDLLTRLDVWLAEARVDDAAAERRRVGSLRAQADEDAAFVDLLVDLGERGDPIALGDASGASHRGRIRLVGTDVVVVAGTGPTTIVGLAAVAWVRSDGESGGTERRVVATTVDLRTVCALLAEDRPRVRVCPSGGGLLTGELRGVGLDLIRLRLDTRGRTTSGMTAWVPLPAIVHIAVVDG